ncbi:MAG TPA: hypothetical protein VFW94_09140 [Candidatus Acidoferrales bacterium]|nr:hypothetical protein [Candidatus Acidoferrales bacterium]
MCKEHDERQAAVIEILQKVAAIVTEQLRAFRESDRPRFKALDEALELAVGQIERRIGAMRQHEADHGCQKHQS